MKNICGAIYLALIAIVSARAVAAWAVTEQEQLISARTASVDVYDVKMRDYINVSYPISGLSDEVVDLAVIDKSCGCIDAEIVNPRLLAGGETTVNLEVQLKVTRTVSGWCLLEAASPTSKQLLWLRFTGYADPEYGLTAAQEDLSLATGKECGFWGLDLRLSEADIGEVSQLKAKWADLKVSGAGVRLIEIERTRVSADGAYMASLRLDLGDAVPEDEICLSLGSQVGRGLVIPIVQ